MPEDNLIYSEYYNRYFSADDLEEAYILYCQYNENNNLVNDFDFDIEDINPELLSSLNESEIDTIVYHAEFEGFEV